MKALVSTVHNTNQWLTTCKQLSKCFSLFPRQVELGPLPWHVRWERYEFKGLIVPPIVPQWRLDRIKHHKKPWEKYDLMKQYRGTINEVETDQIMGEVHAVMPDIVKKHSKQRFTTPSWTVKTKS